MAEQIITCTVNPDGTYEVEAAGFKGKGCEKALDKFKEMGTVIKETKKPEYYENPGSTNTINANGR